MNIVELRSLEETRAFVTQGLWLQRVVKLDEEAVRSALQWALEIAGKGEALPPIGFVADLGQSIFRVPFQELPAERTADLPGLPHELMRTYEDYVLGKIFADVTFDRAADVLRHYQGRDQARGLAFFIERFMERSAYAGVVLNPAVLKTLMREQTQNVLQEGWQSSLRDGIFPPLIESYQSLIKAARHSAEVLGSEDIFELEYGTALSNFGQRLALRQVLAAARTIEDGLPSHRLRPLPGRQEVPSRVLDEDTYPVGGFSSLSTRGTIESLLFSQLAYMEKDDRPDLFDVKYLRDELLYYARDENTFLRRRRTYVFALFPDLIEARFKDAALPYQRIILSFALLLVLINKLADWLADDALRFEIVFIDNGKSLALEAERELLAMLLRDQIENGTATLEIMPHPATLAKHCALKGRKSLCRCLMVGTSDHALEAEDTIVHRLEAGATQPKLRDQDKNILSFQTEDPIAGWIECALHLLQLWI